MSDSRFFKMIIAIVPMFTAGLYLLGLTYHEGFLSVYGVEPSLFPLASDVALLQGFFALIPIGLQPFIDAVAAIFLVFVMGFLATMLSSSAHVQAKFISWLRNSELIFWLKKFKPTEKLVNILDKSATAYLYFSGLIFLILLPFFIAILS